MTASHTISRAALALLAGAALGALPARADDPPCPVCEAPIPGESVSSASTQTVGFVGLRWNFGAEAPAITAGLRHTRTDVDEGVLGAKLDVSLDLKTDFSFAPTVRLLGVAGNRNLQGELGLGIQTADWQGLMTAGVQLPYVNAGANLTFDGTLAPFIEANGLGRPSAPIFIEGGLTCASNGFWLEEVAWSAIEPVDGYYYLVEDAAVVDGYTCFDPN